MSDWIKNISSPLSERAKSPFYGSFIVTWLIWNWRILFVIFFTSKFDLKGMNLSDFILKDYLNIDDGLWIPLAFTAGYLIILPWIDYLIIWYTEWIKRLKMDRKIAVSKTHSIP